MSIIDYMAEALDGREFDTIEEYNQCVEALGEDIEDELGKAIRFFKGDTSEAYSTAGVVIQEVLDEEEKEDREAEAEYHRKFGDLDEDGNLLPLYRVYTKSGVFADYECKTEEEAKEQFELQKNDESGSYLKNEEFDRVERID